jgi:integrase
MKGHKEELGKDYYRVVIEAGRKPDGKRNRLYFFVHGTPAYTEKWMADKIKEIERDGYKRPSKMTVAEYMTQWYEFKQTANLSPKTLEGYELYIRLHVTPRIGGLRIEELEPLHIQRFYSDLREKLSPTSIERIHQMLHNALKQAVKWQILPTNPAAMVEKPKRTKYQAETLQLEDYGRFIERVEKSPARDVILFSLHTSMRRGEVLALRWQDIDFASGMVYVRKNLVRVNGKNIVKDTKTTRSSRPIMLTEHALDMLYRLSVEKRSEFVFCRDDGSLRDLTTTGNQCKRVVTALGLDGIRLHDLRHTHATWLLQQGVHPKIVQERLGHSTIRTTLDIYSHVIPSMQREAVDAFEKATNPKWRQNGDNPPRLRRIK